jgi:WW domain-binding protein 4
MTEYWVSQGKKWCDYCKIYIANNPSSLRNHEYGQRHKESVATRLATIRKDTIAKEKEKHQALKDLERIEAVCCSYHTYVFCLSRLHSVSHVLLD